MGKDKNRNEMEGKGWDQEWISNRKWGRIRIERKWRERGWDQEWISNRRPDSQRETAKTGKRKAGRKVFTFNKGELRIPTSVKHLLSFVWAHIPILLARCSDKVLVLYNCDLKYRFRSENR